MEPKRHVRYAHIFTLIMFAFAKLCIQRYGSARHNAHSCAIVTQCCFVQMNAGLSECDYVDCEEDDEFNALDRNVR